MEEVERLKEFLLEIHMNGGRVCPEFGTCTHEACASNYAMWNLAEAALSGKTLGIMQAEMMQEELTQRTLSETQDAPLALTIQCFKQACGLIVVIPYPAPGQRPACPKCKNFDVVILEDDRCPDGTLNNCALAGGYDEKMCQMCNRGPCPEAARFAPKNWAGPRPPPASFDSANIGLDDRSHLVRKKRK